MKINEVAPDDLHVMMEARVARSVLVGAHDETRVIAVEMDLTTPSSGQDEPQPETLLVVGGTNEMLNLFGKLGEILLREEVWQAMVDLVENRAEAITKEEQA